MADKPSRGPVDLAGRTERPGQDGAFPPVARARRATLIPYLIVLAMVAGSLAWLWHGGAQRASGGTLALVGALLVAALARLVLPESRAGMLACRGRVVDVVTLAALATGLLVAGFMLPSPS